MNALYRSLRHLHDWLTFARMVSDLAQQEAARRLPTGALLPLLARGFCPNKHWLYGLDQNNPSLYLDDRRLLATSTIDAPNASWLDDKVRFHALLPGLVPRPRLLAVVRDGALEWREASPEEQEPIALLVRRERVVAKPATRCGGTGVMLLEWRDRCFWINGRRVLPGSVRTAMTGAKYALIEEHVRQGAYAAGIYPCTVNTIRMLTMLEPGTGAPFLAAAVQRIGCARSFPADNASRGGLAAGIDPDSGRLTRAASTKEVPVVWQDRHPETGASITGTLVPSWRELRDGILALAARLPALPQIAWDVAVLDDGFAVIEANSWSGVDLLQMHRPLLADARIRRFYAHHGIV